MASLHNLQSVPLSGAPAAVSDFACTDAVSSASASTLPIESIADDLEYLRVVLPPAILSSCQSADAQLSKAQDQLRYVIVGGPPGSGKSTLIEAVTGALELLPSGGSTQSLTMVPTWLRSSVPTPATASTAAVVSSSSDRGFSLFIAHSVHNGSWDLLRRKTLERWQRSLESYEPISSDDAAAPSAIQVLLESQALDVLKSVYPILSTSQDASGTTNEMSKLFTDFISLAPTQLTVPEMNKPLQAEMVVHSWMSQLNLDGKDAPEEAAGNTNSSPASPAGSSSSSPSSAAAVQSMLAGIADIGTRREQVFDQLTAREVKFLLGMFAVDHREVVEVARLLILRAILNKPSLLIEKFKPIFHSLQHENKKAVTSFRSRMLSDSDTARSLAVHLRSTGQESVLLPVDILNMWPLVSRIEVRGRFELPPHVCLVDSAGNADEHQVVDPIQAVADGLHPSIPSRIWYLLLGERCRAHTTLLDPLVDLKRFGVPHLRLVLTKWDKVEDSSTSITRSDLAQHLANKLSANAKQLESQIYPVSGMACKALREPNNKEFRKGITMDRYEAPMQEPDVDDLFGTSEDGLDAVQPSGVEQLTADVCRLERDVETDIRQQACVLVQEMFNALSAAQDMANLPVPDGVAVDEDDGVAVDEEKLESDEVTQLDDNSRRLHRSQKASVDIYRMLRDNFESKLVQVRSTLSALTQFSVIQKYVSDFQVFDDVTPRDLVVRRIDAEMAFLYHPKQLQVFLTSRGSFTACQRVVKAKPGATAKTPKVFRLLEDLTATYQAGAKPQHFWKHVQTTLEQLITNASIQLQLAGQVAVDARVKHIQTELMAVQQALAKSSSADQTLRVKLYFLTLELQHIRHVKMQLQVTEDGILYGFQHEFEAMRIRHCNLQSVLQSDCMKLWLNMWEDVDAAVAKASGKFSDKVVAAGAKLKELLPPLLDKAYEQMLVLAVRAVVGAANASIHLWFARLQTAVLRSVGEVQAFHLAVRKLSLPDIMERMRRIHPDLKSSMTSNDVQQALALAAQLNAQTKLVTAQAAGFKRSLDAPDTNPRPGNVSKLDATQDAGRAGAAAAANAIPAMITAPSSSVSDDAADSTLPGIEPHLTISFRSIPHHVFFRGLVVTAPDDTLYPVDDEAAVTTAGGSVQLRSGLVRSSREVVQDCSCATMSGLVIVEAALAAAAAAERQRITVSASTLRSNAVQMQKIGECVRALMLPASQLTFEDVAAHAQLDSQAPVPSKSLAYLSVKHAGRSDSMRDINQQIYSNGIGSFMKSVIAVCTETKKENPGAKLNIEAALTRDDRRTALTAKPHAAVRFRLMRLEAHGWMLDSKHLISPQHPRANLLHLNPYVSLTDNLFHALRYAAGNKVYVHGDSVASPVEIPYGVFDGAVDYQRGWQLPPTADGHPHLLGVVIMLYVSVAEYDRLETLGIATNVQKRAANKQLSIAARVLPEREFSFFGFVSSENLQRRWQIPLLQCEYVDDDWKRFYNITDDRQDEFKRVQNSVNALVKARGVNLPLAKPLQAVRKAFMACCLAKIKFDLQQHTEFDELKNILWK